MRINEIGLAETCKKLPKIAKYESSNPARVDDLFICCCGFEDRSLAMPSRLSLDSYKAGQCLVLTHETNHADNEANLPKLARTLESLTCGQPQYLLFRQEDFVSHFEAILNKLDNRLAPLVSFDISGCSTQMILSILKVLLERRTTLRVLYTEAGVYHPTQQELVNIDDWITDGKGATRGILRASESRFFPGINNMELPNLLVAFPTFKPERILSIKLELQPSVTYWLLGIPHLPENSWREDVQRRINKIEPGERVERISTFEYVDTFAAMERMYQENKYTHHMVIAPHGSKLQCIGVLLFYLLRQDVTIWFSVPKSFDPAQYTSGVKDLWKIDFGDTRDIVSIIRSCGKLQFIPD